MKRIAAIVLMIVCAGVLARQIPIFRAPYRASGGDWMTAAMKANNILRLDFDTDTGTNFVDTSYRANSCISTGAAVAPVWSQGAVWFDGTNDSIDCATGASVRAQSAASISCWIKPAFTNLANAYGETTGTGGYGRFSFYTTANGVIQFTIRDSAADPTGSSLSIITTNNAYAINNWYHVVVVCDSATEERSIYVNGVISTSSTATAFAAFKDTASYSRRVGSLDNITAIAIPFRGYIDGVYVFDRALTAAEALLTYDSTKGDSRP